MTKRLSGSWGEPIPDGRVGCAALVLLGAGFLSADKSKREAGG